MPEPPTEKTPYDFGNDNTEQVNSDSTGNNEMDGETDPFASFGEQIEIDDNDLPF